ncbi:RNA ligase family protein [Spirosoma radiotolerans]|uniref:2'-5' RNA ligase n=1 Tax=Spirosoma radiotolerans TaxID=1379870 RepID=A0A0E3ZXE1_9BACT|nr:RNA ligase family protein [Spirosoma radiotolerans]AKD57039.1 2'-5' RNA ligase [Spirosoma radiotolerans]
MALSTKYGRTYHYPFSPGTTSDDRINHEYASDLFAIRNLIHTEKLDGENNCLSRYGVFARSHTAPTVSPWTSVLRQRWALIRHELGNLEIFGENLFAIHSIAYDRLDAHFFVFAIREHDVWLSWEETQFYARLLDFPTVPELARRTAPLQPQIIENEVLALAGETSRLGSFDALTGAPSAMEGIVSRDSDAYATALFPHRVFKYVRKGHVQTDEHWTRTWRRAPLMGERRNA